MCIHCVIFFTLNFKSNFEMVQYCVVPQCKNSALTPEIAFHRFPHNINRKKTWITMIRRDDRINKKVSNGMRICSAHFKPDDYKKLKSGRKFLKKSAIPSIFPFTSPRKLKPPRRPLHRIPLHPNGIPQSIDTDCDNSAGSLDDGNANVAGNSEVYDHDNVSGLNYINVNGAGNSEMYMDHDDASSLDYNNANVAGNSEVETNKVRSSEVATENPDVFCLQNEIKSFKLKLKEQENKNVVLQSIVDKLEKENNYFKNVIAEVTKKEGQIKLFSMDSMLIKTNYLVYYTGFQNKESFHAFHKYINPNQMFSFSSKLSEKDQILLVLSKLRQGFENSDLAFRFNVDIHLVTKIFIEWLNIFYIRLGCLNIWPNRNIILKHSPSTFIQNYPTTILILDCTELKTERPSSKVFQSQTYSSYKCTNTCKGLIGCDPSGGIIFISELYTGNISDKDICEKCGIYKILKEKLQSEEILKNDAIMVDKGFNIKNEIESLGLKLNIPPMANNDQFEEEEVYITRRIASCRIHVERAIRKVKAYKILSGTIPITLLPYLNQIWTICCILSGFRISLRK